MTQIQIRRGTQAAWTAANPILAQGEMGYEIDNHGIKVGDGSTAWNSLSYFPVSWSALLNQPAVIAAGVDKAAARNAIDAAMLVNGKVPVSQLPSSLMQYQGVWNPSTNTPTLADGTGDPGDVYRVTATASRNLGSGSIDFVTGDYVIYNGSTWEKSDTTDAVSTVAGRVGDVVLDVTDVANAVATSDSRLTNARTPTAAGQVADISIVAFGASTARAATSYGDFPFGVQLQRAITFTSVTFRCATADASGNLVVELRKNGTQVSGTSTTIAAASQVTGGTSTGTWAFAAGDILTVYVTGVGTTPGKGLVADIKGLTT